jgi:hypothetical protein
MVKKVEVNNDSGHDGGDSGAPRTLYVWQASDLSDPYPSELLGAQFGHPPPLEMALTVMVSSKVVEQILADLHKYKAKSVGLHHGHLSDTVNHLTTPIQISTNHR